MGFLARRFSVDEVRNRADWLNDDDDYHGPLTSAGVRVNRQSALTLTTVWRCVDLLASIVAQSPKDLIVKIGGRSFPQYTKPGWMAQPDPRDPGLTINEHFNQVALSLLLDGNFFTLVYPYVWEPEYLIVLDPQKVRVRRDTDDKPIYELLNDAGTVQSTVGPMQMLHGTWIRLPGEVRGISPLEALRRRLGASIAAEDYAARFFGQGASLAFGVEVPGALDTKQKTELAESLKRRYAGLSNSHAIGILTAGAKFVPGLAPTPEQAQMLATQKFGVEDVCRPFGVPPVFAGSQEPGAASYASAYVAEQALKQFAAVPLTVRIETPYQRIIQVPDSITAADATAQFKINLNGLARGDIKTRAEAEEIQVRSGLLTPDEARALEDRAPLPGGDRLYMQSQMTPIAQLGMTPAAPAATAPKEVAA